MVQHLKWLMEECVVLGRNPRRKLGEFWLVSRVCLRGSMVKHNTYYTAIYGGMIMSFGQTLIPKYVK